MLLLSEYVSLFMLNIALDKNEHCREGFYFNVRKMLAIFGPCSYLRKVTIYLLTSCNTEERIAQNIYIHNSNRNYKKLTTTTILINIKKKKSLRSFEIIYPCSYVVNVLWSFVVFVLCLCFLPLTKIKCFCPLVLVDMSSTYI